MRWLSAIQASTASWQNRSTKPTGPASASCARSRSGTQPTPCLPGFTRTRRRKRSTACCSAFTARTGFSTSSARDSRVYSDIAERRFRGRRDCLKPLKGGTGFTGRSPGGKSRWTGKAQKLVRLSPILLAELSRQFHRADGEIRLRRVVLLAIVFLGVSNFGRAMLPNRSGIVHRGSVITSHPSGRQHPPR